MACLLTRSSPARAQATDHSLRIGTFNAWMLPPPGWGVEVLAAPHCGPIAVCAFGNGPYQTASMPAPCNWVCELGVHEVFDEEEILAGAADLAERIRSSGYDVIALNELWWSDPDALFPVQDTAVSVLVEELTGTYPFSVHTIGDDSVLPFEMSGLALFSKLPFSAIPLRYSVEYTDYDTAHMIRHGVEEVYPWDYLAFHEFQTCDDPDCLASKGVAYVRVHNPDTDRVHNIFWTHLQASYPTDVDEDPDIWHGWYARESQMNNIATMLAAGEVPGPGAIDRTVQDIFLLGDLNIDGDLSNTLDDDEPPQIGNLGEWSHYFAPGATGSGGVYSNVLHDVWTNQHILADTLQASEPSEFGHTTSEWTQVDGDVRYDYILHNAQTLDDATPEETKLCNQHPHLAYNLDSGGTLAPGANSPGGRGDLSDGDAGQPSTDFRSDHIGVMASYNRPESQCSPLSPARADLLYGDPAYGVRTLLPSEIGNQLDGGKDYSEEALLLSGTLHNPGSVQWWRIEDPGSYLIGFDQASIDRGYVAMVFSAASLSVPSHSYRDDVFEGFAKSPRGLMVPIFGHKYVFDQPPYYIKVFHPVHQHKTVPGNSSGTYKFGVRRLGCTNKVGDACPLLPNTPMPFSFPDTPVQSSPTLESLYFTAHVESLTLPDTQQLELTIFGHVYDDLESAIVVTDPGVDDIVTQGGDFLMNRGFDHRLVQEGITTGSTGYGEACPPGVGPMGVPDLTGCNNRITWHHPQPPSGAQERVWRVARSPMAPIVDTPFGVVWTTDLTAFYGKEHASGAFAGMKLLCEEETSDGSPHDEIGIRLTIDDEVMLIGFVWDQHEIADFQQGEYQFIDGDLDLFGVGGVVGLPFRYKDYLRLTLTEADPNQTWQIDHFDVSVLARNLFGPSSAQTLSVPPGAIWSPDGGSYTMPYMLSHGLQRFE